MTLKPFYPPGHKRAGTVKDPKDLTPEERADMEHQQRTHDEYIRKKHEAALKPVRDAEAYFGKKR